MAGLLRLGITVSELAAAYAARGVSFLWHPLLQGEKPRVRQFLLPGYPCPLGYITATGFADLCSTDEFGRGPLCSFTLHDITLEASLMPNSAYEDTRVIVKYSCSLA